jgi:hypothetical protein
MSETCSGAKREVSASARVGRVLPLFAARHAAMLRPSRTSPSSAEGVTAPDAARRGAGVPRLGHEDAARETEAEEKPQERWRGCELVKDWSKDDRSNGDGDRSNSNTARGTRGADACCDAPTAPFWLARHND